ncbi:hypothetical protein ACFFX0_24000 [Citricoccus parietis]|uniref:Secreted protein n=1 Tax=Citricoccus parietis TaxID=592307 RepID=A0ABV5FSS0_9MICC
MTARTAAAATAASRLMVVFIVISLDWSDSRSGQRVSIQSTPLGILNREGYAFSEYPEGRTTYGPWRGCGLARSPAPKLPTPPPSLSVIRPALRNPR